MTDADIFYHIRGFMEPIEWPVIAFVNPVFSPLAADKINSLADCCKPHGCVVIFPQERDVGAWRVACGREDVIIADGLSSYNLDEWVAKQDERLHLSISGVFCEQIDDYMKVVLNSPQTIKRCRFIFTPISTYSTGTKIRSDIKQIAQGWMEYRRWAYEDGQDQVLLYNEGA